MTHDEHDADVIVVGPKAAGLRADRALSSVLPQLSRRKVQKLCEQGRILNAGRPVRKSDFLQVGDRITITVGDPPRASPNPQGRLLVRFESRQWVIVAKPGGQPTAPKSATEVDALANALVAAYPELADVGYNALEPGLLHRLDNGTSGLLVAARTSGCFQAAAMALRQGRWIKRYLALVRGSDLPTAGIILGRLRADRSYPRRVTVSAGITVTPVGADAIWSADDARELNYEQRDPATPHLTRFLVRSRLGNVTFVEVAVGAAFRHQIRAHFAAAGWPLVNDAVYGTGPDRGRSPQRHALHAARVAWAGTEDFEGFDVEEPLPADLAELLQSCDVDLP